MDSITADILVVGGGAGAVAAAIQAARRGKRNGISVVLVSELAWLGGMLTSAGVSAPDGNELAAFQTGIWGEFLKELDRRHPEGLNNGWVSFFTYNPAVGAAVFADWVAELPNLRWISGERSQEVLRTEARIAGVRFDSVTVNATITLDGTELGDVLALGDIPHRWGWETRDQWDEPSAPVSLRDPADPLYEITQRYPVQSPTWVVIMQDFGEGNAPKIDPPSADFTVSGTRSEASSLFEGAWANYGEDKTSAGEMCLNYGRLPDDLLMINWPHKGNDYGVGLHRLIESDEARAQYGKEAQQHSWDFARYIQTQLGDLPSEGLRHRYGLAADIFPKTDQSPGGGFALMPYYRERRRLIGVVTVSERDILPVDAWSESEGHLGGGAAVLPLNEQGEVDAIALGNYANDHHYPGFEMPLASKSIRWGGRWTGTPFTIPYGALIPKAVDGLLVCEKNISVSHIANGATRLQPVVLGIGQAAGMAAALCIERGCEPRALREVGRAVRRGGEREAGVQSSSAGTAPSLQQALITDPTAPAAVIPLFNLPPDHPDWAAIQQFYLNHPQQYPPSGHHVFPVSDLSDSSFNRKTKKSADIRKPCQKNQPISIKGIFRRDEAGAYKLHQKDVKKLPKSISLVTVRSEITEAFSNLANNQPVNVLGTWNAAGEWLLCSDLEPF